MFWPPQPQAGGATPERALSSYVSSYSIILTVGLELRELEVNVSLSESDNLTFGSERTSKYF